MKNQIIPQSFSTLSDFKRRQLASVDDRINISLALFLASVLIIGRLLNLTLFN